MVGSYTLNSLRSFLFSIESSILFRPKMNLSGLKETWAIGMNRLNLSSILNEEHVPVVHVLKSGLGEVVGHEEEQGSLAEEEVRRRGGVHDLGDRVVIAFVEGDPVIPE